MGAMSKRKGSRIERELVELHRDIGVHAERVPLSGASRYRNGGYDIDIYPHGRAGLGTDAGAERYDEQSWRSQNRLFARSFA